MPYQSKGTRKRTHQVPINVHQNSFPKGYVSTFANSRRPIDSVSDATNMQLVQDDVWQDRPPLVRYGIQPEYPVVGRGFYRYNGLRVELYMLNVSGNGKVYSRTDGGPFMYITSTNSYDVTVWSGFRQTKNRVYIFNGKDKTSYINLVTNTIVTYVTQVAPATPTVTPSAGLTSGTTPFSYYYAITASNTVGESNASPASSAVAVNKIRDNWNNATDNVTITWVAPAGATASTPYTIYGGTDPNNLNEIITLSNLTVLSYTDDGSMTLNPYKTAPSSNSTEGAIFTWMYVDKRNAQIFGTTVDNKLYYSAPGTGDFSALNGGGFTIIDDGGDTQLNFVDGFRTGKGDPVITTSSRGAANKGLVNHVTFETATFSDQVITYPNVIEANGQSGTYAPRATVKINDSLEYPTGNDFKNTGTSQNIVNILTTKSVAQGILPDVNQINLEGLPNASGVEYQDIIYYALPIGGTENSEIWLHNYSRKGAPWILRWPIAAKDIWLSEDNQGNSHLCVLVNNVILEFNREMGRSTTDDGQPFPTRLAFSSLVWDEDGISLGKVNNMYVKLLQPKGNIMVNTYGLTKRGATTDSGSDSFKVSVSFTGIGEWDYSGDYVYGGDVGMVGSFAQSTAVLRVRPKGLLNQLDWEILTQDAGCGYIHSSTNTRGTANTDLIYQGIK